MPAKNPAAARRMKIWRIREKLRADKPLTADEREQLAAWDGEHGQEPHLQVVAPAAAPEPAQAAPSPPTAIPALAPVDAPAMGAGEPEVSRNADPVAAFIEESGQQVAAPAASSLSEQDRQARRAAIIMPLGFAADELRDYQADVELTMGRPWMFKQDYWHNVWLPLMTGIVDKYLPDWFTGPLVDALAVSTPPMLLMRTGRKLEKAGYVLGVAGEPGRGLQAKNQEAPPPAVERRPTEPTKGVAAGGVDLRKAWKA